MAFFGLENNGLEEERRRYREGRLGNGEDIAVFNWGGDDYDGLGNALQEGGDDLNDETFGGSGPVGKDFDFTVQQLPGGGMALKQHAQLGIARPQVTGGQELPQQSQLAHPTHKSRESAWDDKSPFSVLRTSSSIGRRSGSALGHASTPSTSGARSSSHATPRVQNESPQLQQDVNQLFGHPQSSNAEDGAVNYAAPGVRSLAEVEAEMQAASQRARDAREQEQLRQQLQLQQQQQQQMRPPRMRSDSPSVFPSQVTNANQRFSGSPDALLQQQRLVNEMENLRIQEANRHIRKEAAHLPMNLRNQVNADQMDVINMEIERLLQQGVPQHRIEELLAAQARRPRQIVPDEYSNELQRQIALDQRRQAQLASVGLMDQRRGSPMDHQFRVTMANEMALRARTEGAAVQNATQAEIAQLQMQQRLLSQLAEQEVNQAALLVNDLTGQGIPMNGRNQEALRNEANRKIMEAEQMERKRRRKLEKIAHMSRYNDLMTQSDKDFITRIQVSQLVTSDPYTEDFYAQVYGALLRDRMGVSGGERVLKFGSGEGVGLGLTQRGGGRRPNAMQRMEAQVERIVNNARQREKEKGLHAIHSLQGALGKTAGRSYKAAPRQLLQVDTPTENNADAAGAAKEAAKRGREALGMSSDTSGVVRKEPLTRRKCLVIIEGLYDTLLKVEQLHREQPPADFDVGHEEWEISYKIEVGKLWDDLQVLVPLETSDPHPFVSLMMPAKGKKILPRIARHLSSQQMLTLICLIVACFSQFDVVKNAPILDLQQDTPEHHEVDRQTQLFLSTVLQAILPVIATANLRLIGGMLGLLLEHCDTLVVLGSRPGLSLLTALLSRVEVIKTEMVAGNLEQEIPSEEDLLFWQNIFEHLFQTLAPHLLYLFPSARGPVPRTPAGVLTFEADLNDQPVWQFLATLSLHANGEQQQAFLVATLRERILENVTAVSKGFVENDDERTLKITNVNIFLHAFGLDSSQISL